MTVNENIKAEQHESKPNDMHPSNQVHRLWNGWMRKGKEKNHLKPIMILWLHEIKGDDETRKRNKDSEQMLSQLYTYHCI